MKTIITTLGLFIALGVTAQKTDRVSIDYQLELLPLNVISKERIFQVAVTCDYAHLVEQWKKEKRDDIIPTLISTETETLIVIPGFTQNKNAKDSIKIIFSGLEYQGGSAAGLLGYHPLKAKLKIKNDKGEIVYDDFVPMNDKLIDYSPGMVDKLSKSYAKMEVLAKNKSIDAINLFLKTNYGYNVVKGSNAFFDVKDKKHTYPEMHEAIEKVKISLVMIGDKTKKEEVVNNFKTALTIWEKSLTEFNATDKEARINKNIGAALYLNIALAQTWLHNFEKADEAIVKVKDLDQDYNRSINEFRPFFKDYSQRIINNNKY